MRDRVNVQPDWAPSVTRISPRQGINSAARGCPLPTIRYFLRSPPTAVIRVPSVVTLARRRRSTPCAIERHVGKFKVVLYVPCCETWDATDTSSDQVRLLVRRSVEVL